MTTDTKFQDGMGLPGLRSARERKGLKLQQVADLVSMRYNHLWRLQNGRGRASTKLIGQLCKLLDVTPNDLMLTPAEPFPHEAPL